MSLNLQIDRGAKTPLYQQLADQIQDRIGDGRLPPGTHLPPVRRLAEDVGVTRLTAQNAYAELQSGGWVEATVGRGGAKARRENRKNRDYSGAHLIERG